MLHTLHVVTSLAFFIRFASAFDCVQNGTDKLPATIQLAAQTKLSLEIVDATNKKIVPVSYFYQQTTDLTAIYHENVDNTAYIVKKDKIAIISPSSYCVVKNKTTAEKEKNYPLLIDFAIDQKNTSIFTLNDLFEQVLKKQQNYTKVSKYDEIYDRYTSCQMVAPEKFITISVTVPDAGWNSTLPTHVEIKFYEGKNASTAGRHLIMRFLSFASTFTSEDAENLLPPKGVDCGNFNSESSKNISLTFPNAFSFSTNYVNISNGVKNYNHIFVDYSKQLVSFDYKNSLLDQTISSGSNFTYGDYKIVHDFTSGLEYVVNKNNRSCYKVDPIPARGWGDVTTKKEQNKTDVLLSITQAFNMLFGRDISNFSYVGVRNSGGGLPADVFISTVSEVVYEIWVSNKTGDEIIGTVSLSVYRKINNKLTLSSTQFFYDFKQYDNKQASKDIVIPPLYMVDVKPCLTLAENYSYLVVELFSEKGVENITFEILKDKLRSELAQRANVSLLRITDFFFQPVNRTILYIFFVLADRSPINGSETIHFDPEINAAQAHENLNKSLNAQDLVIQVDNIQLKSTKDSLNFVPPFFVANNGTGGGGGPIAPAKSSKGGMAALAIFMLILGMAGGFGLAFFLYRRNRGIPYQIYE